MIQTDELSPELKNGLLRGYADASIEANLALRPQFISNDPAAGRKVLVDLENELRHCDQFAMSVAFVTMGGITPLLQTLKELEERKIPGKILTTDYLTFSDPKALEKLASLKNLEVRMYRIREKDGFHTKGYLFREGEIYRMIIGSSNMTQSAITTNKEWNTKLVGLKDGEVIADVLREFQVLWDAPETMRYEDFIEVYRRQYKEAKLIRLKQKEILRQHEIAAGEDIVSLAGYRLEPNSMQLQFIDALKELKKAGKRKALLISATGTGKTYAAAFAMRELHQKRVLFLVHREQIDAQAMESFRRVLGSGVSYGILSGNRKDTDADYIFATVQTMARDETLRAFDPHAFDTIVIDEVHRAGAPSYQKIVDYFEPGLLLGMTATPERTDGFDIYQMFDHNIAAEIRLQQAMEDDLLCPFHYFGITDLEIDGRTADDDQTDKELSLEDFQYLTSDERVRYIMEKADYYGYSGDRVKGIMFVSRRSVGEELSRRFNAKGLRTVFLSGDASQEYREACIDRLVSDGREDCLDYILTVDIFNEGVDIPEVNQVIMLRPTQSPIIFVQQLGRGLRKLENKEYVVILDFIGNYEKSFNIPIALSGDRTYNKDNIRRYVQEGSRIIPGASTIHFDAIARNRIFKAIDEANFSDVRLIRQNYQILKTKLGRIPSLMDFDRYGEMDVLRIFDNQSLGSYYRFLVKYEKSYTVRLPEKQAKVIAFISQKLASGKRVQELELLNRMLHYQTGLMKLLKKSLAEKYNIALTAKSAESVADVMTNQFPAGSSRATFRDCVFIEKDESGDYRLTPELARMLQNQDFYDMVQELVEFGIHRYRENYSRRFRNSDLVLYQKYTYEDVCRLLDWKQNVVPLNIGGYKYDADTRTFPVFINYDKADDITDTTKYEDHFVTNDELIAVSKSGRTTESADVQNFLHARERGITVELFVRKNKDDKISKEFYYLGTMTATGRCREFIMPNTDKSAVEIEWRLDVPVRQDIYDYIVNE